MGDRLKVGVVGLRRGMVWVNLFSSHPHTQLAAICDLDEELSARVASEKGLKQVSTSFDEFIEGDFDLAVICTPLPAHAEQSVKALEHGKYVLSEVPAADSIEGCEDIVRAVERTGLKYMLAENCCYTDMTLRWREIYESGEMGKLIYAEAEYVHDCRGIMRNPDGTPTWRASMPPIHYCTHSLGPLLFITGDRCVTAVGMHTGGNVSPDLGAIDMEVGLFRTEKGAVIKILCGFSVEREPPFHWYVIYGTEGCLESPRSEWDRMRAYFKGMRPSRKMKTMDLSHGGHGTPEGRLADAFVESILEGTDPPIDVYRAMDYTAPGICAHISAESGSVPVQVPSFKTGLRGTASR